MKRLWLNADDFGLSPGVSAGIVDAMLRGVLGTTTALVGGDVDTSNISDYVGAIGGRIGLHLQLTDGRPRLSPAEVPSLVDDTGRFPRRRAAVRRPNPEEVAREWRAQVHELRALGIEPSHLDSHHHVHLVPGVFDVYVELAREQGVPARAGSPRARNILRAHGVPCADHFSERFESQRTGAEDLLAILEDAARVMADGELLELMCHPGRPDETLAGRSDYVVERGHELETLLAPDLEPRIAAAGFRLLRGPADD